MGTWGIGLFEDDITMDVKDYFNEYSTKNKDLCDVAQKIIKMHKDVAADKDEGPLLYFALAEIEMEHGFIEKGIKDKCLEYLGNGSSLDRWTKSGIIQFMKRRKVLKKLLKKLKSYNNVLETPIVEIESSNLEELALKYTIYVLEDKESKVRYVGSTSCFDKRKQYMENLFRNYKCKAKV